MHDSENPLGDCRIRLVWRVVLQPLIVVIDFPIERRVYESDDSEVMFSIRVIVFRKFAELLHCFHESRLDFVRVEAQAFCEDNCSSSEAASESVVENSNPCFFNFGEGGLCF